MKKIDWSNLGGYPLAQDDLEHLSDGVIEVLNALAKGLQTTKFVITGCAITRTLSSGTVYDYAVAAGWVYFDGRPIRVPAMSLTGVDESTHKVMLEVVDDSAPLTFEDLTTPNVLMDEHIILASYVTATIEGSTKFNLSGLVSNEWKTPTYSGTYIADVSNPVQYRKNLRDNSISLRGLTDNSVPGSVTSEDVIFVLPTGYRPSEEILRPVVCAGGSAVVGAVRVKVNGEVCLAGDIFTASNEDVWVCLEFPLG